MAGSHQSWQAGVDQKDKKKRAVHNGEEGKELAEDCQNLEGVIKDCNKEILQIFLVCPLPIDLDKICLRKRKEKK